METVRYNVTNGGFVGGYSSWETGRPWYSAAEEEDLVPVVETTAAPAAPPKGKSAQAVEQQYRCTNYGVELETPTKHRSWWLLKLVGVTVVAGLIAKNWAG